MTHETSAYSNVEISNEYHEWRLACFEISYSDAANGHLAIAKWITAPETLLSTHQLAIQHCCDKNDMMNIYAIRCGTQLLMFASFEDSSLYSDLVLISRITRNRHQSCKVARKSWQLDSLALLGHLLDQPNVLYSLSVYLSGGSCIAPYDSRSDFLGSCHVTCPRFLAKRELSGYVALSLSFCRKFTIHGFWPNYCQDRRGKDWPEVDS